MLLQCRGVAMSAPTWANTRVSPLKLKRNPV